jgi:hypothetical protein
MTSTKRRMHQTTVRFGKDLWEALELEAEAAGVSVAQFIREAAVARLGYAAARRGDPNWDRTMGTLGAPPPSTDAALRAAESRAIAQLEESSAVLAQSRQARLHAQALREKRGAGQKHVAGREN